MFQFAYTVDHIIENGERYMLDKKKVLSEMRSWTLTIIVVILITTILNIKVYARVTVEQSSMENTLFGGQSLLMDKISYSFSVPKQGDIVIFLENSVKENLVDEVNIYLTDLKERFGSSQGNERLIKRVIGVPGDKIDIKDGAVYVNDVKLEEPYAKGITEKRELELPVIVPEDSLFVIGDNRDVSKDSRTFGVIGYNKVEGKAVFRVGPLKDFGKIE
jgi:signal peptidase I